MRRTLNRPKRKLLLQNTNPRLLQRAAEVYKGETKLLIHELTLEGFRISRYQADKMVKSGEFLAKLAEVRGGKAGRILTKEELQAYWSQLVTTTTWRDDNIQLKASELLARSHGLFIDKQEIKHDVNVHLSDLLDE